MTYGKPYVGALKTQEELIEKVAQTIEMEIGPCTKTPISIISVELDGVDVTDCFCSETVVLCPRQN